MKRKFSRQDIYVRIVLSKHFFRQNRKISFALSTNPERLQSDPHALKHICVEHFSQFPVCKYLEDRIPELDVLMATMEAGDDLRGRLRKYIRNVSSMMNIKGFLFSIERSFFKVYDTWYLINMMKEYFDQPSIRFLLIKLAQSLPYAARAKPIVFSSIPWKDEILIKKDYVWLKEFPWLNFGAAADYPFCNFIRGRSFGYLFYLPIPLNSCFLLRINMNLKHKTTVSELCRTLFYIVKEKSVFSLRDLDIKLNNLHKSFRLNCIYYAVGKIVLSKVLAYSSRDAQKLCIEYQEIMSKIFSCQHIFLFAREKNEKDSEVRCNVCPTVAPRPSVPPFSFCCPCCIRNNTV
eukprot:snap_masked-scaffold_6-processed-gene-15.44-mRNA-1 protein AED:1.00 eAED:1.00 QI:0/-1/0/0/-1/1/1/0/347